MVRIAGVDVPDRKRAHIALRSIYGIGPAKAIEIVGKANLDTDMPPRMNELSEQEVDRIRVIVDQDYICLLYTSPSPRDGLLSRMPSSA